MTIRELILACWFSLAISIFVPIVWVRMYIHLDKWLHRYRLWHIRPIACPKCMSFWLALAIGLAALPWYIALVSAFFAYLVGKSYFNWCEENDNCY